MRRRFSRTETTLAVAFGVSFAAACSGGGEHAAASSTGSGGGAASPTATSTAAGPVAVSSGASATSTSASTGSGSADDAQWQAVSWWHEPCPVELAGNPIAAFPRLEWAPCLDGAPGCEMLIENWPKETETSMRTPVIRRASGGGQEIGLHVTWNGNEYRQAFFDPSGEPTFVYRMVPLGVCVGPRAQFATDGYYLGAQSVAPDVAAFAYQPAGSPLPAPTVLPIEVLTQRQAGRGDVFAVEREAAQGIHIFDRATGSVSVSPPSLASLDPRVVGKGVLYLRAFAPDDYTAWIWDRPSGEFRELLNGGANIVTDIQGDETTLVWIETPMPVPQQGFPRGTIYTSPFTTRPAEIVSTARWADLPTPFGSPATIGGGYYAVASYEMSIFILRLADGHRWTMPMPDDGFGDPAVAIMYVDEEVLYFKTSSMIFRQRLDALGAGEPSP